MEAGNDHPKSKTLYKRVLAKYGKSVPRWICEMFPKFCPVYIWAKVRKKTKAGHQPLLTRGMGVLGQIDLIDYQSMSDGHTIMFLTTKIMASSFVSYAL